VQPEPPKPAPAPASEPDLLSDEVQVVSRKSTELALMATQIQVINQVTQEKASEYLLAIAALRKEIADTFKPMKDAAFKAHRIICDQERTFDAPLAEAEGAVKRQIGGYVQVQQRLAREAEQQAREEAQRVAAEESRLRTQEEALQQAIDLEERGDMQGAPGLRSGTLHRPRTRGGLGSPGQGRGHSDGVGLSHRRLRQGSSRIPASQRKRYPPGGEGHPRKGAHPRHRGIRKACSVCKSWSRLNPDPAEGVTDGRTQTYPANTRPICHCRCRRLRVAKSMEVACGVEQAYTGLLRKTGCPVGF
jgi:hypothetical protein